MNFSFWEKTMFFKKANLIFVAAIFVAFSGSLAEAQTKKGSDTRYVGNSKVGGKLHTYGELKQRTNLVRAFGKITAYARLFGKTYETVGLEGKSQVYNGKSSNIAKVKLGGFTIYSKSKKYGWGWGWKHTQEFFQKDKTIFVNGVPINVEIRLGGTLSADLDMGVCLIGAGLQGKLEAKVWGKVTAGIDFVAYRAGLRTEITLFNNILKIDSTVTPHDIAGEFQYQYRPVKIVLKVTLDRAKITRKGLKIKRKWKEVASKRITWYWSKYNITHTFLSW